MKQGGSEWSERSMGIGRRKAGIAQAKAAINEQE